MRTILCIILLVIGYNSFFAQVTDYRDPFLGLYHSSTPPCNNGNEQTPPNHYILIEKDTQVITDIIVTDTMFSGTNGFIHYCTLNQSDSTYVDGAQLGKFVAVDSLKVTVPGWICGGSGSSYYLHKIIPIGLFNFNKTSKEWYLFPNPTINELNIVLPNVTETLSLSLFDVNSKQIMIKDFKTQTQLDMGTLPKGVYVVRIKGKEINLSKRVVLVIRKLQIKLELAV